MTPALRLLVWTTTALVFATGAVHAWLAYAATPGSPFDVVNHPWQPATLHAHVLVAPIWLVVAGAAWQAHVLPRLRSGGRARRRSGLLLLVAMVPMVASGYLLQTADDEIWRGVWRGVHLGAAVAWTAAFVAHVAPRRADRVHASMPSRRSSSAVATSATVPGGCA